MQAVKNAIGAQSPANPAISPVNAYIPAPMVTPMP